MGYHTAMRIFLICQFVINDLFLFLLRIFNVKIYLQLAMVVWNMLNDHFFYLVKFTVFHNLILWLFGGIGSFCFIEIHPKIHRQFIIYDLRIALRLIILHVLAFFDSSVCNNNDLLRPTWMDEHNWIVIIAHFIILVNLLKQKMFVYFWLQVAYLYLFWC